MNNTPFLSLIILNVSVTRLGPFLFNLASFVNVYASVNSCPAFEASTSVTFNVMSRSTFNFVTSSHSIHQKKNNGENCPEAKLLKPMLAEGHEG